MSNLPGNPHASVAMERLREMTSPESEKIVLDFVADALVQSNLAVAHELRTLTLANINLHNRREAARQWPDFEDVPNHLLEMIAEKSQEINERLGATDD